MGKQKEIRQQQDSVMQRTKALSHQLYLAGLGAYSKTSDRSEKLYDQYIEVGQEAYGDNAASKPPAQLAGKGLVVSARKLATNLPTKRHQLYQKLMDSGQQGREEHDAETHSLRLAGLGAVRILKKHSQELFDDLVSSGEKQRT